MQQQNMQVGYSWIRWLQDGLKESRLGCEILGVVGGL